MLIIHGPYTIDTEHVEYIYSANREIKFVTSRNSSRLLFHNLEVFNIVLRQIRSRIQKGDRFFDIDMFLSENELPSLYDAVTKREIAIEK